MSPVLELFLQFILENKALVIVNMLLLMVVPLQDVVLPHYYGKVMDAIRLKSGVLRSFVTVVLLLVTIQLFFLLSDYHDTKILPTLMTYIRKSMMENIIESYETNHREVETGALISKIAKLPEALCSSFERLKNYILPYAIVYIVAGCYFFYVDVVLGLGFVIIVVLFLSLLYFTPRMCENISRNRHDQLDKIHESIDDVLRNLYSVYGASQQPQELDALGKLSIKFHDYYGETIKCNMKFKMWVTPAIILYLMFFLYRCYFLISHHQMPSSKFIPPFIILLYILNSFYILNDQLKDSVFEWGIIKSCEDVLQKPKKTANVGAEMSLPRDGLGLSHVTFRHEGAVTPILNDVTLHIQPGEKLAIVGEIGSGKSTIVKLLLKYYQPTSGIVYLNGKRFEELSLPYIRNTIGYVPQHPVLFNRTVAQNILYGTQVNREELEYFLEDLDLKGEFENLERGLDTRIGKNGSKLSGGQKQLVWFLRIILTNPDVLVLDEPTASVDPRTKDLFYGLLHRFMAEKTLIMVTHDPSLVDIATRVITMQKGQLIADNKRQK